jgi:hypothetical protein
VNGSSTLQNFSAQYGSTTEIQSSSNAYFATSGGSVGIGTTNPAGKLEVYDSVGSTVLKLDNLYGESNSNAYGYTRLTALTGGDGLLLSQNVNTTDSSPVVNSPLDSSGQAGEAISMGQNYGGTAFLNYAAGGGTVTPSVAMFVKDNGNVGIGTTGPAGKLEVSNTGDSYSYITTTGTNNAAISWLRTGDGTTSGRYAYTLYQSLETSPQRWNVGLFATKNYTIADSTFGSSPVTIEPNAGNNLLYLKSGNVGIGTTNPGSPLQVQAPATDAVPVAELTNPDTTNGYGLLVAGGGSASTRYAFNVADPTGSTNYLTVKTQTGEVGNVGIGQFNPASPLSVNGGISAGAYSTTAAPSNGMIISGNVGIGTTNPSVTGSGLEVKGVTNDATIKVTGNTGGNAYLQLNAASGGNAYVNSVGSGYIALGANGAASNAMTILSSGNVGIGTTNPDQALTVKGTIDYANTAMVTATVVDDSGGAIGGTCPTFTTGPQQFYIQTSATVLGSYIVYDSTHSGHAQINPPVTISCLSSGSVPYVKVILFQAISGLAVGDTITVYNPAGDLGSATGFVNNINAIVINAAKTTVNGFDLAEQYQTSDASIGPGDVISVDPTQKEFITKTTTSYDPGILGVVSTDPGLVLGNASSDLWRQVALKGRVPVNVTDENGVVKAGDFLTSSASLPGYAMKAASSGEVLGKALEDFDPTSEKTQIVNGLAIHTGSVSLFMNVGWQDISSIVMANASSTSPLLGLQDAIDSATSTLASVVSALGLNLADASAGLDIGSNVTIRGALHVDQIGSIGDILNLESDVNFIGRPYFNSDTGGLAIIQQGALQVDVSFDKPYVNAPVVNASLSLDASSSDAQVQEILGASVGYAVTHRSQNGFSIMLSKPAPEPMTFSWIALAIQNMKISDSGTVGQDLSQPSPNLGEGGGGVGDQNSGGSDASSTPPIDNGTSTPPVDNGTTTSPTDNGTSTPPTTEVGDASSTPPTIDNTGSTTPPVVDSGTGDNGSTTQPTN